MTITICKIHILMEDTPIDSIECPYADIQYKVPFCRYKQGCTFQIEKEIDNS